MGKEIKKSEFSEADFNEYDKRLDAETKILKSLFERKYFTAMAPKCGIELEAWLVDKNFHPAPDAPEFLKDLSNPNIVAEIAKYNFEINGNPYEFNEEVFGIISKEMKIYWDLCKASAKKMKLMPVTIGTLPTLTADKMTLDILSPQKRYFALNNEVMRRRDHAPIVLNISGKDKLYYENDSVITECAATSLQIHYGVSLDDSARYYNAFVLASSFMAAISANSPFFYGKELWDESRIVIFEQSVAMDSFPDKNGNTTKRVTLGNGYCKESLMELFETNQELYPVLLPECRDTEPEDMKHLLLHNGTIWRWNRPLFCREEDGRLSLRIEHRVPSSGPTIVDTTANIVFFIGLVEYLANMDIAPETLIDFKTADKNFYNSCKKGLDAKVTWIDGKEYSMDDLMLTDIIPNVEKHLNDKRIKQTDIDYYLNDVILNRVKTKQNGANWQKAYINKNGYNFEGMLEQYMKYQLENLPVYQWKV